MSTRRRRGLPAPDGWQGPSARSADSPPEALENLLDDMRDLRLTLAADLSTAAAAVEAGSEHVAADIVDADRGELMAFLQRSSRQLREAGGATDVPTGHKVPTPRSWRRRVVISLPAVPLVGAVAMSAAAAAGLLPLPTHSSPRHVHVVAGGATTPVSSTFKQFETVLAGDPSASQVVAAASALHQQIAAMIASAPHDPGGVTEVAQLLQLEQALLIRTQAPGSKIVLAQSRQLAAQLLTVASKVPTAQPTPASVPTASPSPHKSASTKPSTTSSTSPKPSTKPSSSSSPKPSSSPSSSDAPAHIPTIGG